METTNRRVQDKLNVVTQLLGPGVLLITVIFSIWYSVREVPVLRADITFLEGRTNTNEKSIIELQTYSKTIIASLERIEKRLDRVTR